MRLVWEVEGDGDLRFKFRVGMVWKIQTFDRGGVRQWNQKRMREEKECVSEQIRPRVRSWNRARSWNEDQTIPARRKVVENWLRRPLASSDTIFLSLFRNLLKLPPIPVLVFIAWDLRGEEGGIQSLPSQHSTLHFPVQASLFFFHGDPNWNERLIWLK